MWDPGVWTDEDGNQVLVNIEDGRVTHVATRTGRTWGPPLEPIVKPRPRTEAKVELCSDCGERPILTTDSHLCASCLIRGLRV